MKEDPKTTKGKTMNGNQTIEVIQNTGAEDEQTFSRTRLIAKTVASAGGKMKGVFAKVKNEKIATCVAAAGGAAACGAGVTAAVTAATATTGTIAAIGAAGTGIGATVGGILGLGIGLVSGGTGIAATVPFAIGGGALGGSAATAIASTCASALGIATAPVWAVPVAVGGGITVVGAGVFGLGRHCRWW